MVPHSQNLVFHKPSIWFVMMIIIMMSYLLVRYPTIVHSIDLVGNECTTARTCSECISISKECKWCASESFKSGTRCRRQFSVRDCSVEKQIDPQIENLRIIENRPFSDSILNQVQLKPQRIEVQARVGTVVTVGISYKRAEDYPMDLYYLMDLSCTMWPHKRSVARVGRKIANKIQATTKDFRIGFGSFVDKETIPFSNYKKISNKITCHSHVIEETHSFINHMSLADNATEFEGRVANARISGNLDSPEGTLDALMQVMACQEEIGWRKNSDKIIVVATDETFHYAGDGRIGGILLPNDGQCRLTNNRYNASVIYDYPSMKHIADVAQKKKFNIVFTVGKKVISNYQSLADVIGHNSRVASLSENDDLIATLIDEVYRNISTTVQLVVEHKPDNVDIDILSRCADKNAQAQSTTECKFSGKMQIQFQIRIRLKRCSFEGSSKDNHIRIGLLNKNETVEINLKELCKCECELHGVTNSEKCSHNGTFSCGICTTCNGIRSGKMCECDPEKPIDAKKPDAHCRKSGDSRPCSGNGKCVCGKCVCDPVYTGEYCEQDESLCYDRNGIKCNHQGECVASQCRCNEHYSGRWCECPLSNVTCISNHYTGDICSSRGECVCGRCVCKQATAHGRFCEKCPLCDAPQYCEQIISCVPEFNKKFCLEQQNITLPVETNVMSLAIKQAIEPTNQTYQSPCLIEPEQCEDILARWSYQITEEEFNKLSSEQSSTTSDEPENDSIEQAQQNFYNYQCLKRVNNCDVSYSFRLVYNNRPVELVELSDETSSFPMPDNADEVTIIKPPLPSSLDDKLRFKITLAMVNCPQPVNMTVVGGFAFGTVFLIGIITIFAWKLMTMYLDRREYERFIMEVDAANFNQMENPLYKGVTARFKNPMIQLRDRTSKFFFNK